MKINKNQIIGMLIAILGLTLGFLWEKTFKYADILDFMLGAFAAIGLSMVIKILPLKLNKK
ncbi:hypothetical protein [Polaribacter ponticola]|uniref:AtpZ/AtpI family protein n=1 Tax=Polaribacter ponticola TaxID=2978475 RepID=A0ABT5SBW5_9FLAO|nr:hypothetical protein [Polaribacter sp. MSW5]MDD7915075.1 hypothetical protein [Polaribacter sp. MSW5]